MGKGRKMIQIDAEVASKVKLRYPSMSWNDIIVQYVLNNDMPKDLSKDLPKDSTIYATKEDVRVLKDKFSEVLTRLIDLNKLKQ